MLEGMLRPRPAAEHAPCSGCFCHGRDTHDRDPGTRRPPSPTSRSPCAPAARGPTPAHVARPDARRRRPRVARPRRQTEDLPGAWRGKAERAALASLRPLRIDVRVESADGQAASRTVTRLLVGEGVRVRRWRDGPVATLHLPAGDAERVAAGRRRRRRRAGAARLPRRARARRRERRPRRRARAPGGGAGRPGRRDARRRWISRCRPGCRAETPARGRPCWPDCVRRNADAPGYRGPRPDVPHADVTTTARPRGLYSTAVGKKYVMAITGIILHGLRPRPHDRQPQDLPRRGRARTRYGEWLRDVGEPALPAHGPALDRADRAASPPSSCTSHAAYR